MLCSLSSIINFAVPPHGYENSLYWNYGSHEDLIASSLPFIVTVTCSLKGNFYQHFHPRLLDLFEVGISSSSLLLLLSVNLFFHTNEIKYRAPIQMNEKLLLFVSYRDDPFFHFSK